ncbi:cupin domain-containing protein [Paraflavitalea pollutisoli]|uniref:cupin domain-containing protein n=1 Tax=Paraflavitalea pollutisoli TaxID=3034143 RepID=UPI0023ED6531|nr:cupin domain-containing protein [Paraflavitalea sp. H1-2-19X]
MAYKGKILRNQVTGQDIIFLQISKDTGGSLLEMKSVYNNRSKEPISHYHPYQEEDFLVLEGELTVCMNNRTRIYRAGESFHIPRGTIHSMWNASEGITAMNWQVRPALQTEYLLETSTGLAADGKTSAEGKPALLQIALIGNRYASVFRLAKPPYLLQRIIFTLLTPFAKIAGYKSVYPQYFD